MSSIENLPDEILLYIFEELTVSYDESGWSTLNYKMPDSRMLASLAQVDRQFNRIATPLLYRQVFIPKHTPDDGKRKRYNPEVGAREMSCLLRTLLDDRSKMSLISEFCIGPDYEGYDTYETVDSKSKPEADNTWTNQATESVRAMIDRAFEDQEDEHAEWLESCIEERSLHYLIALLIANLPAVRVLALQGYTDDDWEDLDHFVSALTKHAKRENMIAPLSTLRTVHFGDNEGAHYPDRTTPLAMIAKWPEVRTIIGCRVGDDDGSTHPDVYEEFASLKSRSTNLEVVRLAPQAKLLGEHLYKFLGVAKALKSFYYHIGDIWAWVKWTPQDISRALSPHSATLESITIFNAYEDGPEADADADWRSMDFSAFQNLTELSITFHLFFGYDGTNQPDPAKARNHILRALPASIAKLCITQPGRGGDIAARTAFDAVIACQPYKLPALQQLAIASEGDREYMDSLVEMFASTKDKAAEKGVEFVVMVYGNYHRHRELIWPYEQGKAESRGEHK